MATSPADTSASTEPGRAKYPHVFQPLELGPVTVPNRIFMGPHGIDLEAPLPDLPAYTQPAAEHAFYFAERAASGVGLIFQNTHIGPFGTTVYLKGSPALAPAIPSFKRVAEIVHDAGAKIMAEVMYNPGSLHLWEPQGPEAPQVSPSATGSFNTARTRYALRKEDIHHIIEGHRQAARGLREAGYDGFEVHVTHGMLPECFLSPYFNHRTDEYGGSLENRARIVVEILEALHDELKGELAVGMRFTADQLLDGGWTMEDARDIVAYLAGTGMLDFIDLDISVEPQQHHLTSTPFFEKKLHNAERVAFVRSAAGSVPVLAVPGRLTEIAEAEDLLARGVADMIGMVRGLIAEPELVKNALEGNEGKSRTCISANHCHWGASPGFGCAVNPAAGREERWGLRASASAPRSMRVAVVGAGPAGLEAARVASVRGHEVTLFEKRQEVGGLLELWSRLPGREHVGVAVGWYERRLPELDLDFRLGVDADAAAVLDLNPDVVIIATGGSYNRWGTSGFTPAAIPGWDSPNVVTPEDVLLGGARLAGNVIIVDDEGGTNAGSGFAELAARDGATSVTYVSRYAVPVPHLTGYKQAHYIGPRLRQAGVALALSSCVMKIDKGSATIRDLATGEDRVVPADVVVLATMRDPVNALSDELAGKAEFVYTIGDALAPRGLREATYEGHRFARVIGEDDMPRSVIDEVFRPMPGLRPAAQA
jgi:2,4-dienoyl-CoA reductase-like NADH-dependent reductase (Old Yellow Enzyme family)